MSINKQIYKINDQYSVNFDQYFDIVGLKNIYSELVTGLILSKEYFEPIEIGDQTAIFHKDHIEPKLYIRNVFSKTEEYKAPIKLFLAHTISTDSTIKALNAIYPIQEKNIDRISVDKRVHISPPGETTRFIVNDIYLENEPLNYDESEILAYNKALELFKLAVENGSAYGQYQLAAFYLNNENKRNSIFTQAPGLCNAKR
jgi:hypothetical protein